MEFYLAGVVILSAVVSHEAACPTKCTCNGVHVYCREQFLEYIPNNLPNTTYILDLRFNNISDFNVRLCYMLPNLTKLHISNNRIGQIPDGYFIGCDKLTTLDIGNNLLTSISEHTFTNMTKIIELQLYGNDISMIHERAFINMAALQTISLAGNNINMLDYTTFRNCTQIQNIDLGRSNLIAIDQALLQPLRELVNLFLFDNRLTRLDNMTFSNCKKLQILNLGFNYLTAIDPALLQHLGELVALSLDYNRLKRLDKMTFSNCTQLKGLDLSRNSLIAIDPALLQPLGKLENLDLSWNSLIAIDPALLQPLGKLVNLDLQNNKLRVIRAGLFYDMDNLEEINLSGNDISIIESDAFGKNPFLQYLYLTPNPLSCSCSILPFWTWLTKRPSLGTSAICSDGTYVININSSALDKCYGITTQQTSPVSGQKDTQIHETKTEAIRSEVVASIISALCLSLIFLVVCWLCRRNHRRIRKNEMDNVEDIPIWIKNCIKDEQMIWSALFGGCYKHLSRNWEAFVRCLFVLSGRPDEGGQVVIEIKERYDKEKFQERIYQACNRWKEICYLENENDMIRIFIEAFKDNRANSIKDVCCF